jgi:thiosulfate/3-mercaptopyruvate sulfurtransferase
MPMTCARLGRRLRRFALGALAILAASAAVAAPAGWKPLLTAAELADMLAVTGGIRVVQVTGSYSGGHIPGSVSSPYADWRGPPDNLGALPSIDVLRGLVQRLGITASTPVVIVHEGAGPSDMGSATRVYWTLKSLGIEDLSVLNGGLDAWIAGGGPISADPVDVAPSDFAPQVSDRWRATTGQVADAVERGADVRLVDARPADFFEGLRWTAARPGTVSGAENLSYERWFEGDLMVGPERARAIAEEAGLTASPVTITFCNVGHWASIDWFALSELAGIANTRLYAESMAEWTRSGGSLDNSPGRVRYYWMVTRDWFARMLQSAQVIGSGSEA